MVVVLPTVGGAAAASSTANAGCRRDRCCGAGAASDGAVPWKVDQKHGIRAGIKKAKASKERPRRDVDTVSLHTVLMIHKLRTSESEFLGNSLWT